MAKGCCLLGTQHWRELLFPFEVALEWLNDTVTKLRLPWESGDRQEIF
jgi:hypothetical protein